MSWTVGVFSKRHAETTLRYALIAFIIFQLFPFGWAFLANPCCLPKKNLANGIVHFVSAHINWWRKVKGFSSQSTCVITLARQDQIRTVFAGRSSPAVPVLWSYSDGGFGPYVAEGTMLTAMVAGFYDAGGGCTELYAGAGGEFYTEFCFGMQDACSGHPCAMHGKCYLKTVCVGSNFSRNVSGCAKLLTPGSVNVCMKY